MGSWILGVMGETGLSSHRSRIASRASTVSHSPCSVMLSRLRSSPSSWTQRGTRLELFRPRTPLRSSSRWPSQSSTPLFVFDQVPSAKGDSPRLLAAEALLQDGRTLGFSELQDRLWAATGYRIADSSG